MDFLFLCLFFVCFSFGQLGRVELGQATIYLHDFIIITWVTIKFNDIWKNLKISFSINSHTLLLLFITWVLLGMGIAYFQTHLITPFLYLARISLYIFFIISLFSRNQNFRLIVKILLISSGVYMACFGLLQYLLIPDSRYLWLFGWDEHYYRLIGSLLDPNLSGMLYILIGWLIVSVRQILPKPLAILLILLLLTAIVLTYSRATYISLTISAIVYFINTSKKSFSFKKLGLTILIIIAICLVYLAAPKPGGDGVNLLRTTSIKARLETTQLYFSHMKPYQWLLGSGLYSSLPSTSITSHAQVPDNLLALLIVQTGVIGTSLVLLLCAQAFKHIVLWEKEVQAALVAILIHAQFNNSLLEPFILLTLGIMILSQTHSKKLTEHTQQ